MGTLAEVRAFLDRNETVDFGWYSICRPLRGGYPIEERRRVEEHDVVALS